VIFLSEAFVLPKVYVLTLTFGNNRQPSAW